MMSMLRLTITLAIIALATNLHAQSFRIKRIQREQHTFSNGIVKTDSVMFFYPGNRAGQVDWRLAENISHDPMLLYYSPHPTLQYDSMVSKIDYSATTLGVFGTFKNTQRFNSLGWVMDFYLYQVSPNGSSAVKVEQKNTYNGGKLGQAIINKDKYVYNYKNGVLDKMTFYPASAYGHAHYYNYSYDQAGNLKQVLHTRTGTLPSYDSVWTLYNYDNQNRIVEQVAMEYYYSWIKDTSYLIQYWYDGNGDLVQEDSFSGFTLQHSSRQLNTYNNQHNKTELIWLYSSAPTSAIDTQRRVMFTYDNYNLLTKLETQRWNNGQWISAADTFAGGASHTYTFEYEVAWPTEVPEVADAANVKLYPSPASDFIRIETEWKDAQPFTAAILDMQGRVIRQWDEPATKTYARTIPLTELPAGNYILKLHCGDEQLTKKFVVYK